MKTYDFTLVLSGVTELTDELADRLFEAGCDDGSPGSCNRVVTIDFHRRAASLEAALRAAITSVRTAGCRVERIEIDAKARALRA
ncbi:MAG: hypothetical protein HYS13_25380 [Planctomycetia bacterium]|nr:hypothetical protein [Planctomycetia bacterium]